MIEAPTPPMTARDRLAAAHLRPTRQRLALVDLIYGDCDRHLTAETLHNEAKEAHIPVSLATIYNTLRRFTACGLLREVPVAPGKAYFDTNVSGHHHFFFEENGDLVDIPAEHVVLDAIPSPPAGSKVARVDVIIRLAAEKA